MFAVMRRRMTSKGDKDMFRKVSIIGLGIVSGLLGLCGCVIDGSESGANAAIESQTEQYIDLDNNQKGALGLIFGMPQIDDRLDFDGGDREDWRYIIVTGSGTMSITINIDNPSKIDGGWNIYDSELRALHSQSFSKNQGYYEFKNFPVKRGTYYFKTYTTGGKSIYTIATAFQPTITPAVAVAEPEPVEEVEVVEPVRTPAPSVSSSSGSSGSSGKVKESSDSQAETSKSDKDADSGAKASGGTTVVGSISGITPKPDGSTEITIMNAGKNKGIEAGDIGTIESINVKVQMTQCFATKCRALVPSSVNSNKLKGDVKVKFNVK